ncbi:hypothetical protein KAI04_03810 [Candidatus Pacearchaeota archaeon]|nr:hypothetical protein [Candidatus Pacearchaeota archaeon]
MVIKTSTFISDIVIFIRNLIRDNIDDPLQRKSGFVLTAYPKRQIQYPIITIRQTNITTRKLGMSSEVHEAVIDLEVRVWARNAKEIDELTASVIDILRDAQYSSNGTDNEDIYGFTLTSANSIVDLEGENTIHSKVLGIEYRAILS